MEALGPELVVVGPRRSSEVDGSFHLKNTREYMEAFEEFGKGVRRMRGS